MLYVYRYVPMCTTNNDLGFLKKSIDTGSVSLELYISHGFIFFLVLTTIPTSAMTKLSSGSGCGGNSGTRLSASPAGLAASCYKMTPIV